MSNRFTDEEEAFDLDGSDAEAQRLWGAEEAEEEDLWDGEEEVPAEEAEDEEAWGGLDLRDPQGAPGSEGSREAEAPTRRGAEGSFGRSEHETERRGFRPLTVLLLLLVLLAGGHLLFHEVERLAAHPFFRLDPARAIAFDWGGAEPLPGLAEEVDWPKGPRSIFDPGLLDEMRTALQGHPRVAEVEEVERVFPNRLRARFRVRRPIGRIVGGEQALLVGREGHVLGISSVRATRGLPRIEVPGAPLERVPAPGRSFDRSHLPLSRRPASHAAVMEVLDLLDALGRYREHPALRHRPLLAVRAGEKGRERVPSAPDLSLHFAGGLEVCFGRAPRAVGGPGLRGVRRRLDGLETAFQRHRGLNGFVVHLEAGPPPTIRPVEDVEDPPN